MTTRGKAIPAQKLNLYDVLQVSPSASQEVIHAAYRTLARSLHPDVNQSQSAAQKMRQLNAAYYVLGDHARRADYDLRVARAQRTVSAFVAQPAPVVRGKPRPDAPRRVEDQRARELSARSVPVSTGRPRLALVLMLVVVLALAITLVLWLSSMLVGDVPDASMIPEARVVQTLTSGTAQPILNLA